MQNRYLSVHNILAEKDSYRSMERMGNCVCERETKYTTQKRKRFLQKVLLYYCQIENFRQFSLIYSVPNNKDHLTCCLQFIHGDPQKNKTQV